MAFLTIAASGMLAHKGLFYSGVVLLGLATGLATVSNLSLMLDMTTAQNVGLFIGAWGMADALARLTGSVLSGAVRDLVTQAASGGVSVRATSSCSVGDGRPACSDEKKRRIRCRGDPRALTPPPARSSR